MTLKAKTMNVQDMQTNHQNAQTLVVLNQTRTCVVEQYDVLFFDDIRSFYVVPLLKLIVFLENLT
jgi:hypothetical protein